MVRARLVADPQEAMPASAMAAPLRGAAIDDTLPRFDKEEVNYRYAADPQRACGACAHFDPEGSCRLVAGLIRSVDTCDRFAVAGASTEAVDDWWAGGALDFGATDARGNTCDDAERDADGLCPGDPDYDDFTAGEFGDGGDWWEKTMDGRAPVRARLVVA